MIENIPSSELVRWAVTAPLSTNSLFEDVVIGVVVALLVFGIYYRFILRPARRKRTTKPSTEDRSSRRDTGN